MSYKIEVAKPATKKIFGLKTVAHAFEYGSFLGLVCGSVGGFLVAKTYYSDDLSRVEKTKKLSVISAYSMGGLFLFVGGVKLVSMIKLKG